MYYKISPFIIVLLTIVIIGITAIGIRMFISNRNIAKGNGKEVSNSDIVPVLELSTNTEEENQESILITAVAKTDDEAGIYSITLPDGSATRSDTANYEVKKNGNYTFKVKGNNGQIASMAIEVKNIREASAKSPYIPTGFSHIGGEVENGFVIQDQYGNEFVWVPVESGKLTRNTLLDNDYEESTSSASALVNSVAQNYGFYIARYEASSYDVNGQKVASSMGNKSPWRNLTYSAAVEGATNAASAFGYEGYYTAIMNSYAWDTVLQWLDTSFENYSTNTSYGNYSGTIRSTGTTQSDIKNNICDLAGNVREWTTEIYKPKTKDKDSRNTENEVISETVTYRVIRGGAANLSRTASSHTGYKENMTDEYWGFRMILYK